MGQENSKIYFGFYGLPMKRSQHSHLTSLAISYQNSGCSISDQLEVLSSSGLLITLNHNSPVRKEHRVGLQHHSESNLIFGLLL